MSIEATLSQSLVLRPFWALASLPSSALSSMASQSAAGCIVSRVTASLNGLLNAVSAILSGVLAKRALYSAYSLSFASISMLSAVASTDLIGLAVFASLGLTLLVAIQRQQGLRWGGVDIAVAAFFASAVLSACFSSYVMTSIEGLVKFATFGAAYLSYRYLIESFPRQYHWVFALLMLIGLFEVAVGAYQYINHVEALATWQDPTVDPLLQMTRIFGTLQPSNPNLLAGFLIPIVPLVTCYALQNMVAKKWPAVAFGVVSVLGLVGAIVLTGSRGGYLALGAMAVLGFLLLGHLLWHQPELKHQPKLKAIWLLTLLVGVGGVVLAVLAVPAVQVRLASIFAWRGDSSNAYRITVWGSAIRMVADNWLLGIGPGNDTFKQVYGLYMTPGFSALGSYSVPLEILVEQGIVGFLAFLTLILTLVCRVAKTLYALVPIKKAILVAFTLVAVVGSLKYGTFDTIWYRPAVNVLFWFLVAVLAVETAPEGLSDERGLV
jgi:putative inorganic carbon (hco3(-)) transporter